MAIVWIPSLMRDLTGGKQRVEIEGKAVGEIITALDQAWWLRTYSASALSMFPLSLSIRSSISSACSGLAPCDKRLAISIQVSVDGRIASLGLSEPVDETSEVHFLPAISGG